MSGTATCRFCHQRAFERDLLKYGLRHYAHPACYFDAGKPLEALGAWKIANLPFKVLKDRGLLERAEAIIQQDAKRRTSPPPLRRSAA